MAPRSIRSSSARVVARRKRRRLCSRSGDSPNLGDKTAIRATNAASTDVLVSGSVDPLQHDDRYRARRLLLVLRESREPRRLLPEQPIALFARRYTRPYGVPLGSDFGDRVGMRDAVVVPGRVR